MGVDFDFAFLTMNNRGYQSALDLSNKGYKVAWLDMSEQTRWSSKDFSGPLPFHVRRGIDDNERNEFLSSVQCEKLSQGLSLMTEDGVLELKGEIVEHQVPQFKQGDDLNRLKNSYEKTVSSLSKGLKGHWLAHFFAAFNKSVTIQKSLSPHLNLKVSDIFGDTFLPVENFSHRQSQRKSLQSKGIEVLGVSFLEIRVEGGKFFIKSGDGEMSSATEILNFLESSDLCKIDSEFSQQVFHKRPHGCEWHWTRLSVAGETEVDMTSVPRSFFVLPHWDLPWLEENFMVVRKGSDDLWSLWCKVKNEPEAISQNFLSQLKESLTSFVPIQEISLSVPEKKKGLDLELFPLYQEKPQLQIKKGIGFHPMGFDQFHSFDQFDMFQSQKIYIDQLLRRSS